MRRRTLTSVFVLLATMTAAQAKGHRLGETIAPGDCFRVELTMNLEGSMVFVRDGKKSSLPIKASASHSFPERVLSTAKDGTAEKVVRVYDSARAAITTGKHSSERSLRAERRLFVAQWNNDQPLVYCPSGPLYRTELELCSEHFDTMHLVGLLPGKLVDVGDSWKIASGIAQAFCHFEGLIEHTLTGKFEKTASGKAIVRIAGTAKGVEMGAMVKVTVDAAVEYDLEASRIVKIEWKQKDEREIGPASPASTMESTTVVTRKSIVAPEPLSDKANASLPRGLEPPANMLQMDHVHAGGVFDLLHERDWTIVSDTESHLVLRLMDRGEFIAQATVAVLPRAKPGKTMTPEEFERVTERTGNWKPEKTLLSGAVESDKDRKVHRLAQLGRLDDLDVMQTFYLIAHEDGRQLAVTCTLMPKLAERLGTRDLSLVGSIDFPKGK